MIKNSYYIIAFIILICLGCVGWYIAKPQQLLLLDSKTLLNTPDAIINNLTVTKFNADGSIATRLITPQMKHIPNNNTSLLDKPNIISYQENQAPWKISALNGKAINGSEKVTLTNDVFIHQPASPHNKETNFHTEKLYYYPQRQYADTDIAITLTQPGTVIKAIGMQAYLEEKKIKFLNRTRGRYEAG